ncbi:hypothetical protein ACFOET_07220 [Parapedobacter deserti]|uniref:Integral membrane protein n=1 Tax=Parapedobacter deserti TaxID=1912957 RepID=A0ABV7JKL8_9SPHI
MTLHIQLTAIASCFMAVAAFAQDSIPFSKRQNLGSVRHVEIHEASGLVASRVNARHFWTHNDSGDAARIFLIDDSARHKATFYLEGIHACDWEDIGVMERQGVNYLVVGDIGDNAGRRAVVDVHIFEEPLLSRSGPIIDTIPNAAIRSFALRYEDGSRDAESLFFDPIDERLYVVSKRELRVGLYYTELPKGLKPVDTLVLRREATLPLTFITAADISPDGTELLMKNLVSVFYWTRKRGESVADALSKPAVVLPYLPEPQGEAIAFSYEGKGYYTLSEAVLGMDVVFYFYNRL